MLSVDRLVSLLPAKFRSQVASYFEALEILKEVRDWKVLAALGPSGLRGLVLQRGKQGTPTRVQANHAAHFDWTYPQDHPEMQELYRRAKQGQWDGETYLPWHTDVDPLNPEKPLIDEKFLNFSQMEEFGMKLDAKEKRKLQADLACWSLSQFLHGEQGALFAAAQVTEAVQFFDGKFYGATQVVDEGRHVEVFLRYLETKLGKFYQINDNLFVIIDALMSDSRWDMKFLGMQIMVEGLALGAFGAIYRQTREPLLKELLRMVIQDEARHVHYGVLALREHFNKHLSDREKREREDWAFEVALLMRNRFMAWEVYEEWGEGTMTRDQWKTLVTKSPGFRDFRKVMFSRLVPNLREIGLLSARIMGRYEEVGLLEYFGGAAADKITGDQMIRDLDAAA
jgi:hypothetical protein